MCWALGITKMQACSRAVAIISIGSLFIAKAHALAIVLAGLVSISFGAAFIWALTTAIILAGAIATA